MWGQIAAAAIPSIASTIGGFDQAAQNKRMAKNARKDQMDAAKHGLGWRIQDAVANGLSPLVGAGASTTSISPTMVDAGNPLAGLENMGQNIGRAINSNQSKATSKIQSAVEALSLERAQLQNELLKSQITSINNRTAGTGPGDGTVTKPSEQTAVMQDAKYLEAADKNPGWKIHVTGDGGRKMMLPSPGLKEAIEDSPYEMQVFISDLFQKLTGKRTIKDHSYDPLSGEFVPDSGIEKRKQTARDLARKLWRK